MDLDQMFSIVLKQKTDGQIRISSIRVDSDILREEPFIKEQIKNLMERELERNHILVLKDVGVVQYS